MWIKEKLSPGLGLKSEMFCAQIDFKRSMKAISILSLETSENEINKRV